MFVTSPKSVRRALNGGSDESSDYLPALEQVELIVLQVLQSKSDASAAHGWED